MALVDCKECGNEVSSTASACPKCGAKVKKAKLWFWIPLGLVAGFLVLGAIVGASADGKERSIDRRAIELCWDEQQKKSLDPGSQRFIASSCEMMERQFQEKYGIRP